MKKTWTKKQSSEFAEHLESRGMTIVSKESLDKTNAFVSAIMSGLNVADPANAGRKIAAVWGDHLELLNTAAKAVLALGTAQRRHDEELLKNPQDPALVESTKADVISARTRIEALADHLSDKDRVASDAVKKFAIPDSENKND